MPSFWQVHFFRMLNEDRMEKSILVKVDILNKEGTIRREGTHALMRKERTERLLSSQLS